MNKVINIESVKDTFLYKELIKRNSSDTKAFVGNIPTLCEEASDRAKQMPKIFNEYTLHDKTHFLRVTQLMSYVLGNKVKELNDIEIGLLILSAFYHDQGMIIEESEFKELEKSDSYIIFRDNWIIEHANYVEIKKQIELSFISNEEKERLLKIICELDSAMLTCFLRESHGKRIYDYILKNFSTERILNVCGTNLSDYLAKICLSHTKSVDWITDGNGLNFDENIGTFKVNTIFLSIVLRIADILDFDSDRTPDVLFKSIHFTSPISISEWQKHRSVKGWEISSKLLRFTMYFEHPVYEKTAHVFLDWIDSELNYSHSLIRKFPTSVKKYQIEVAEKVDRSRIGPKNNAYLYHDLEFTLSRDEIVKLLMTDKLYRSTSLFIRELLQNSLDALRLRKAIYQKDGFEWNLGKIDFKHYIDSKGQQVIECKDNGSGMDEEIVSNFLGKVGRSYYRSPEFERKRIQLKEKGVDFEPCSQFGIGFMSCFMIGDRIQILTKRDYGYGIQNGKPLIIEINGLGGLIVVKEGLPDQDVGTTVRVYSRENPIFYDHWSDKIRLILTLKGYALATEFPINAICSIDEIKGELNLPETIDKKKTFLEYNNIRNIKTIEIDLSTIDKNLRGYLRQSFLVDKDEFVCAENDKAKWEIKIDNITWKDKEKYEMTLFNKESNERIKYDYHLGLHDGQSVCLDGILVCGYPGRTEFPKLEMMMLGQLATKIYAEHPFTIDVRGNIKPELNPAREPLDKGSFLDRPIGWMQLQNLVNKGSGMLWEQVLNLSDKGLSPETFWKLIIIYDGYPGYIPAISIFKHLQLPIENNNWIKLSSIRKFYSEDGIIYINDFENRIYPIHFPDEIINLGKAHVNGIDFNYLVFNLLTSLASFQLLDNNTSLILRNTFLSKELPSDNSISQELSSIKLIPFEGLGKEYITTTKHTNLANSKNPLVKLVLNSRYVKRKDELQEFAHALVFNLCYLIQKLNEEKKSFTTQVKLRSLKYTSLLFQNINWDNYLDDVKPPYKIYIDQNNSVEITSEIFNYWAKQQIKLPDI